MAIGIDGSTDLAAWSPADDLIFLGEATLPDGSIERAYQIPASTPASRFFRLRAVPAP